MNVVTRTASSIARTGRVYIAVVLAAPIMLFVGVEGWRTIDWAFGLGSLGTTGGRETISAIAYIIAALSFVGEDAIVHKRVAAAYVAMAGLHVLAGTASLYGLVTVIEGLIPSLSGFDPMNAAFVSMSVLLVSYVLFHRRVNR